MVRLMKSGMKKRLNERRENSQSVDFSIDPWWGVCLVNFTIEEFKKHSEDEMATVDKICKAEANAYPLVSCYTDCRGTCSKIMALGKLFILIPSLHSDDGDQLRSASLVADIVGSKIITEEELYSHLRA